MNINAHFLYYLLILLFQFPYEPVYFLDFNLRIRENAASFVLAKNLSILTIFINLRFVYEFLIIDLNILLCF